MWDAVVTPNEERVVAVATLIRSAADLKPVKSRSEKRILSKLSWLFFLYMQAATDLCLVYNLKTKEIEK